MSLPHGCPDVGTFADELVLQSLLFFLRQVHGPAFAFQPFFYTAYVRLVFICHHSPRPGGRTLDRPKLHIRVLGRWPGRNIPQGFRADRNRKAIILTFTTHRNTGVPQGSLSRAWVLSLTFLS